MSLISRSSKLQVGSAAVAKALGNTQQLLADVNKMAASAEAAVAAEFK